MKFQPNKERIQKQIDKALLAQFQKHENMRKDIAQSLNFNLIKEREIVLKYAISYEKTHQKSFLEAYHTDQKCIRDMNDYYADQMREINLQKDHLHLSYNEYDGIRVQWTIPKSCRKLAKHTIPIILSLHGGSYIKGSPEAEIVSRRISEISNIPIYSIDYGLAPEEPFPKGLNDVVKVYSYLLKTNYLARNIILLGVSAGGGLALAVIKKIQELSLPTPAGVICCSPWTNLKLNTNAIKRNAKKDPTLVVDGLAVAAKKYLSNSNYTNAHPLVSPYFANYEKFPPLLIQVGDLEILADDGVEVAIKAANSNVEIWFKKYAEMPHVFHNLNMTIPEVKHAYKMIKVFISSIFSNRSV